MLRITFNEPESRQESVNKEPPIDRGNLEKVLEGPKYKIVKKETFPDVPILRFLKNNAIIVLFEGRPAKVGISGSYSQYETFFATDDGYSEQDCSSYWSFYEGGFVGGGSPEYIDAYPGCTATVIKVLAKKTRNYEEIQAAREYKRNYPDYGIPDVEPDVEEIRILIAKDVKVKRV